MEYNDYELVWLAQENNEDIFAILRDKYKDLIYTKSRKVFNCLKNKGIELSDVIQEAMLGFDNAVMAYNQDDSAVFYTFAMLCIDRSLNNLVVRCSRSKYKLLNDAITFDYDDDTNLHNIIGGHSLEEDFFDIEDVMCFYEKIKDYLTKDEFSILKLKAHGYSYNEISVILNSDCKYIYNAIDKIRKKLKKFLNM